MPGPLRRLTVFLGLAFLAGCTGSSGISVNPALLRLEYLERAPRLPRLRVDGVEIPESSRLGRTSDVLWRHRDDAAAGEFHRALPQPEPGDAVRESLVRVFESFGFDVRGWTDVPQVFLRVQVKKLLLSSEGEEEGSRACDLELAITVQEAPSGLEITRFGARGRAEFAGSWTRVRGGEPRWIPVPDQSDPLREAAAIAALAFLEQSSEFWKQPANWRPSVRLPGRP